MININEHHYMKIIMNLYIYIQIHTNTSYYVILYHSMLYHSPYKLYNYGHILAGHPPWLLFRRQVSCESPGTFGIPGTVNETSPLGPQGAGFNPVSMAAFWVCQMIEMGCAKNQSTHCGRISWVVNWGWQPECFHRTNPRPRFCHNWHRLTILLTLYQTETWFC